MVASRSPFRCTDLPPPSRRRTTKNSIETSMAYFPPCASPLYSLKTCLQFRPLSTRERPSVAISRASVGKYSIRRRRSTRTRRLSTPPHRIRTRKIVSACT
ncbi:unnamed protein product, partial [Ectocarpus sp. 12 AP-2014]